MNESLLAIIKRIVAEQGESILNDPKRLKSFVSDYARWEPKEDRIAFGRSIENGFYTELKQTSPANRTSTKASLVSRLQSITGYDAACCTSAIDLLECLLFGNSQVIGSQTISSVNSSSSVKKPRQVKKRNQGQSVPVSHNKQSNSKLDKFLKIFIGFGFVSIIFPFLLGFRLDNDWLFGYVMVILVLMGILPLTVSIISRKNRKKAKKNVKRLSQ